MMISLHRTHRSCAAFRTRTAWSVCTGPSKPASTATRPTRPHCGSSSSNSVAPRERSLAASAAISLLLICFGSAAHSTHHGGESLQPSGEPRLLGALRRSNFASRCISCAACLARVHCSPPRVTRVTGSLDLAFGGDGPVKHVSLLLSSHSSSARVERHTRSATHRRARSRSRFYRGELRRRQVDGLALLLMAKALEGDSRCGSKQVYTLGKPRKMATRSATALTLALRAVVCMQWRRCSYYRSDRKGPAPFRNSVTSKAVLFSPYVPRTPDTTCSSVIKMSRRTCRLGCRGLQPGKAADGREEPIEDDERLHPVRVGGRRGAFFRQLARGLFSPPRGTGHEGT